MQRRGSEQGSTWSIVGNEDLRPENLPDCRWCPQRTECPHKGIIENAKQTDFVDTTSLRRAVDGCKERKAYPYKEG